MSPRQGVESRAERSPAATRAEHSDCLLSLLDDDTRYSERAQARAGGGTRDEKLLAKVRDKLGKREGFYDVGEKWTHKGQPTFEDKVIKGKKHVVAFAIKHFGATVPYCVDGFCDKNADPLDKQLLELMQICHDAPDATSFTRRLFEQPSSDRRSLAFKFRDEMGRLVDTLQKCSGHFVRCIKPNDERRPFVLDPATCTPQLQSCGVLEAARVAQAGFPKRIPYREFVHLFLKPNALRNASWDRLKDTQRAQLAKVIARKVLRVHEGADFVLGRTKVFLRRGVWEKCTQRQAALEAVIGRAPERTESGQFVSATGLRQWRLKHWLGVVVKTVELNLKDVVKRRVLQEQLAQRQSEEEARKLAAEKERAEQEERRTAAKVKDAVARVEEAALQNLQAELASAREAKEAEIEKVRFEMQVQLTELTEKALAPATARCVQLEHEIADLKARNEELHEAKEAQEAKAEEMQQLLAQVAGLTVKFAGATPAKGSTEVSA